jgi:hypothetical protein
MNSLIDKIYKFLTKNKIIGILLIILALISGVIAIYSFIIKPNADANSVYVSPEKKLIKSNMADYSFPLKIVNEKSEDFNDIGLKYTVPADYGIYRIMIKPKDETERIGKYNNSLQIMLPCFGWQEGDKYISICDIESIYKLEIKEYEVTINTRDYNADFFIEFEIMNLSQQPQLKDIFKSFGDEG